MIGNKDTTLVYSCAECRSAVEAMDPGCDIVDNTFVRILNLELHEPLPNVAQHIMV